MSKSVWVCSKGKIYHKKPVDARDAVCTFNNLVGGDCRLLSALCDAVEYAPVLDYSQLDRLMSDGHYFSYQDGAWHLFDKTGEGAYVGKSVSAIIRTICGDGE